MHSSLEPVRFGSRFFCLCGDTRKKIVAIQIALFSACVDTRKNSRDFESAIQIAAFLDVWECTYLHSLHGSASVSNGL